jgi:aldehyde dehydrogenase (NAD+)
VPPTARLFREEVFGPVLTVTPYETEDDAVALANDSAYGLAGSIWTSDEGRGIALSRRIVTGSIGVNHYLLDFASPFGGVKDSGLGRELGPEGLTAYEQTQSVYLASRPS